MGGVKCQPFLKRSNHWKQALKATSREAGASSFLKMSLLLQRKKAYALSNTVQYKFLLFCRRETAIYITVTNFGSKGKPML